ncbi:MAG: IS1 family transposase [Terriglobales bacterium]|jgi:IS1 family transposase
MYTLSAEKKLAVISALLEGNSIRSINRMTDVDRNTIASLLLRSGDRCAGIIGDSMQNLRCGFLQCDEIWTYVGKKQRRVRKEDSPELGDQWVFIALDEETKLVPYYQVSKRTREAPIQFLWGLKRCLSDDRFQITTDGWHFYRSIQGIFAGQADFAQLVKLFGDYGQFEATSEGRYSPPRISEIISKVVDGRPDPDRICTSHVERNNLTLRMQMRRFTRLTNAFSKRLAHLKAACALHFAHYNFCRVHSSLRITPAMAAGIASEIWPLSSLLA